MRSIAYYWKEGLRNIFKHGFMSVAAVVIMVVSLLLTGTVTLVAYNITNNITRLQQSNQIVVWIDDSLTTREAKTLQTQFEKIDNIASIAFEDRDVALEQYRKELGDDADILEDYNADNNPLRNSYVFTLSDSMQADATIQEIEAVDGVASVRADEDVIRKLIQIQRVFNMLQEVGVFAVFQSVVALFRQLFPVDETVIIFFKSARHYIGEQFCLSGMDILIHLFLALLLQIALAGGEPYKHGITVGLHILVHKIGKNNRLSATRRTF